MQVSGTDKKLIGKTILVAEDVEMNQQLIQHILESFGASVSIAKNGAEALDLIKKQAFDCIIMDVQMPEMDGIQATKKIRDLADPIAARVPIIALTANSLPEDLLQYEQAGMDDFLAKPIVESQLLDAILSNSRSESAEQPQISSSSDKLYDLAMIHSVSGGDAVFIKKMIHLFIETVPQNVQELVDATGQQNWAQVAKMAHKLKSTVDSMGIRSLHEQIRTVEQNAKNLDRLDSMPEIVKNVELVVGNCIRQLRVEIN